MQVERIAVKLSSVTNNCHDMGGCTNTCKLVCTSFIMASPQIMLDPYATARLQMGLSFDAVVSVCVTCTMMGVNRVVEVSWRKSSGNHTEVGPPELTAIC